MLNLHTLFGLLHERPDCFTMPAVDIVDIAIDNFMSEIIESNSKAVIVQFWAPWCGPCKQLGPVLEKVISGHNNLRLASEY